ncbi:MAG: phenylalanine--tRNA ligase subunit beta [Candidatus Pacearchaeota archaeon]|jgi:phenylalanyl-tRNA synthetase beta chain
MTILTLNRKQLEKEIGKITEEIENKISMFGTPVEDITENEFSIEIFPNRPDLLSFQGFTRAIKCFLKKPEVQKYKLNKPEKNYQVIIDKSVKKVRPFTACAIVKNLKLDDEKIKEIIDIQEKLHGSYGRDRKKLAIGIYPLETIKLPITFLAKKPEEIKFQPLEFPKEITGRQILSQHPAGREYGNLLKNYEEYPIFQDADKQILSMPPIINSHKTGKITETTKEVFIECSGFHPEFLKKTLNMIVCAFANMGGEIYQMEIKDSKKTISPDLEPEKMQFKIEDINKNLGLELSEKEIKNLLEKMGLGYEKNSGEDTLKKPEGVLGIALIPAYRTDILHTIDLVEEIAIAYGYDNFIPELPKICTIGEENNISVLKNKIAEILIGLNILETSSYHLSTKEKQFKNMNIKEFKNDLIEVETSKTENNILRNSLLANSINILSQNSEATYPQQIFELGKVFENAEKSETGIKETEKLCVSLCSEKANFTEIKQILDYLMRMLNLKYEIKETEDSKFIEGRTGSIIVNNKEIGVLGEIHPVVLKNNKIKMPVASMEIDIEELV